MPTSSQSQMMQRGLNPPLEWAASGAQCNGQQGDAPPQENTEKQESDEEDDEQGTGEEGVASNETGVNTPSTPKHWSAGMTALLMKEPPAGVADLFDFLNKFDEHNKKVNKNSAFARKLRKICSAFSKRFTPDTHLADVVGTAFLWHFLVKILQYLPLVPTRCIKARMDIRSTMNSVWVFLGQSSPTNLQALHSVSQQLLRCDGLDRTSLFPGPLKEMCSGQRLWWDRLGLFWSNDDNASQKAVEHALAVYVVCDIVGGKLNSNVTWRFSWCTCFDVLKETLGDRIPDCLIEILQRKAPVLSMIAEPRELPDLASALTRKWSPECAVWCARYVIHSSKSAGFLEHCTALIPFAMYNIPSLIAFVQYTENTFSTAALPAKILIQIAKSHFNRSLPELLVQIALPCKWQVPSHGELMELVAMHLNLNEEAWPKLVEAEGSEGWLQWMFKTSCNRACHEAYKASQYKVPLQRCQPSVSMVKQMSKVLGDLISTNPSVLPVLGELFQMELDFTINAVKSWRIDPLPALLAFLSTFASDSMPDGVVANLASETLRAGVLDSSGWLYVCCGGAAEFRTGPAVAAVHGATFPRWLLVLSGTLAAEYCDIIASKDPRGCIYGLMKELHEHRLAALMECNDVVRTAVGMVCLQVLSKTLGQLIETVHAGCYDLFTSSPIQPSLPIYLRAIRTTIGPLDGDLQGTHIDIWRQFKQTLNLLLTMNCRALSRIQIVSLNQSQQMWVAIADALGYEQVVTESWDPKFFDEKLAEVQQAAGVAGWLATFNVEGAACHARCLATGSVEALTMEELNEKQEMLSNYLCPIAEHTELVTHCTKKASVIFDVAIKRLFCETDAGGPAGPVEMNTVRQRLCECDRQLRCLLSQEMCLDEAKRFFQKRGGNIQQEVEKLVALQRYENFAAGQAQESIEKALEILQYSTETQEVARLINQYHLLQDPDTDPGFLQLQSSQRSQGKRPLAEAPSEFKELKELFSANGRSLTGEHFQLFHKLLFCPEVIAFFRDNHFVTTAHGCQRFEQARQRLTVQLQSQDLETKLLNDVIAVRELIEPFVTEHENFSQLIQAVLTLPVVCLGHTGLVARLDLVQANIGRVKFWFQSAHSSKVESAAVQARMVNESGKIEIELGRLLQRPTTVSLKVEAEGLTMSEEEIRELLQQLALSTRPVRKHSAAPPAAHEGLLERISAACKRCIDKLQAAMKVFEFACALESHGHPQHQARTIVLELRDQEGHDSVHTIVAEAHAHESKLEQWRRLLEEEKRACPFLAAFDARELLLMHVLLDADTAGSCEVVQMMSGQSANRARAGAQLRDLVTQSLNSFLRSVRGLAQQRSSQELAVAGADKVQGNDPQGCLRRLAQFLESNLLHVEAAAWRRAPQGGDDRFQWVANVECGKGLEFAPLASLLEHVFCKDQAMWSPRCILWCDAAVSQAGATAFMQRIEAFPAHSFVLLGVNRLAPQIQQMVCDFQKRQNEAGRRQGRIVYAYVDVDAAPAAHFLAPYPRLPRRSLEELRDAFRPLRHQWAGDVTVICGLPGCGKSTRARALQSGSSDLAAASAVAFLDELDLRRIQASLASLSQAAGDAGAVVRIDISERADWMGVNRALFDLFVFGVWQNLEDGTVYATQSPQSYLVEVPCSVEDRRPVTVQETLRSHFPALVACAGADVEELTEALVPFEVDEKTRFICKFWRAFRTKDAKGRVLLNRICHNDLPVTHPAIENDEACSKLFVDLTTEMGGLCKRQQQCLQRFLHRRFQFFERSPLYLYNSGGVVSSSHEAGEGVRRLYGLGSLMMQQMLREARMLCEPGFKCSVADAPCSILVYDQEFALKPCWVDKDAQFSALLPLVVEGHDELQALQQHERCCALLRWRLQLLAGEVEKLSQDFGFVLVKDFVFKILCIHERKEAKIPVIIEGVTGVGKTYVLRFYAHLLNHRLFKKDSDVEEAPRVVWRLKKWLRAIVLPLLVDTEKAAAWQRQLIEEECTVDSMVELWLSIVEEPLQQQHGSPAPATPGPATPGTAAVAATLTPAATVPRGPPRSAGAGSAEVGPPGTRTGPAAEGSAVIAVADKPGELHILLREQVRKWLEEIPLLKPTESLLRLLEEAAPTPETSSGLLRAFLDIDFHEVFYRLLLHPDISSTHIAAFLDGIATRARSSPAATFVVLLDELNTSSALGFLKAVVVDHKLNGDPLPSNIFFVGCINPHNRVEQSSDGRQEYMVHALPASMAELRWQYPPLRGNELEHFVKEKIRWSATAAELRGSVARVEAFAGMICTCQREFSAILGESCVSQRDIQRCLTIFNFFWKLPLPASVEDEEEEEPLEKVERCMVLSLAIVYYFRVADDGSYGGTPGSAFRSRLDAQLRQHVPNRLRSFREEVDRAVNKVISPETFNIPEGVALNKDLKENLFACLVCVETKVPVCLLGPPGRSKTLAFEVLTQNLLGARSTAEFCRSFCAVDPIVYQCSGGSTGQEIGSVLKRASEREAGYMRDGGKMRCVVFLDEGGLPADHRMALKVLHDPLDDGNLSIIVASNRALDAANQGRMLTVARQAQTQEDYELLGLGLLAPAGIAPPQQLCHFVTGLARAFLQLCEAMEQSFTDRDFVALLRHLRAEAADERCSCPTPTSLLRGLENNFIKPNVDVQMVAQVFFAELAAELDGSGVSDFPLPSSSYRQPLHILADCIRGGHGSGGERSASLRSKHPHLAPRFCMILDGGEDDAVVRLLLQEGLLPQGLEVLHVPSVAAQGSEDLDLLAVQQMARLQHCMEIGQPVLLRNASRILIPFYNLFNQNYRVTQADDGEQLLYIIVAHGARTHFCRVHPNFYVVLHMPLAEYATQPEPLKSRFAQVQVTVDEVREMRLAERLPEGSRRYVVQQAFERCHSFVEHAIEEVGAACFVGLQPRQTVESLCLLHLDCFVDAMAEAPLPSKISPLCDLGDAGVESVEAGLDGAVQTVLLHLLQIARPESLLQFLGTLGNEKLYRRAYFRSQHHFSLPELVRSAVLSPVGEARRLPKLLIQTRTSSDVLNLLKLQSVAAAGVGSARDLWSEIGLGFAAGDVHVLDFDEVDSAALLEDRIGCGKDKRVVLLGVDMRGRSNLNVTWLRDVIDRFAADYPEVLFVLLLHFPPEVVMSGIGLCPCAFLDHWEFFWLDSLGFRTPFREDLLLQVLCTGESTHDLPALIHHDMSLKTTTTEFARRALLPLDAGPPLVADDAASHVRAASCFYDPEATTEDRAIALRAVLHHQPAIWQQLVAAFHEGCQVANLSEELMKLAKGIHQGEQLMSFMDAALLRLQHRFDSMALSFLAQLCSNEGLLGLAEDTTGATAALLRLMPMPKCADMASSAVIKVHSQRSRAGLSPLLCLLHHQLTRHLKRLGTVTHSARSYTAHTSMLDALKKRIEEDAALRDFCTQTESAVLEGYARFLVQLTCGRSLSPHLQTLLLTWTSTGAIGARIPVPASLAHLVAVTGLQGGRLGSLARLSQLLESKFKCLGVIEGIFDAAAPASETMTGGGEREVEVNSSARNAETWRFEVESKASVTLAEALWKGLLRLGGPEEPASDALGEWTCLALSAEHALQTASEWIGGSSNSTLCKQRQMMRMFALLLPGLESSTSMTVLVRSLCARLEASEFIQEPATWLLSNLMDLLEHEPAVSKRAFTTLLLGLMDEKNIWSKEAWVKELFMLIEKRAVPAGADDDQDEFLVGDELALLLLSELRSGAASTGGDQGQNSWPQLRRFLETQGMRSPYLPRHSPERLADAATTSRVADLFFGVKSLEILESDKEPTLEVLRSSFYNGQKLFGSKAADKSIVASAHGYAFAAWLGRWLCSAHDPEAVSMAMLEPVEQELQEAAASILAPHAVPLALEIQNCGGASFLQGLLHNESMAKVLPRVRALLLESGLGLPDAVGGGIPVPPQAICTSLPLCLTAAHDLSPLGDLRPQYKEICKSLATALQEGESQALCQALGGVAAEPLSIGHAKGLLLLAIYHEFYNERRNPELLPLLGWLPEVLPNVAREELRFFECLIAPATHQLRSSSAGTASNHVSAAFALDCRDPLQVSMRHCLVNHLALSLFVPAPNRDHFWMHVSTPGALQGRLAFASSLPHPVGQVHYDCGCVFDLDGFFRHSEQCRHWPLQAAAASYVHCYGAFCLNYLVSPQMHAALYGPVLAPDPIRAGGDAGPSDAAGAHPHDATAEFCYQKVCTSMRYLQASLGLHPEEQCVLLSLVCERGVSKLLAGTSHLKFLYSTPEEKRAAEVEFRETLSDVLGRRAETFEALRRNGAERLKRLCPLSLSRVGGSFESALAQRPAAPAVQVLQRYAATRTDLNLVALVPPLLKLYWFVHEELNQHLQGSLTVEGAAKTTLHAAVEDFAQAAARTPEQRQRSRELHKEGVDAFNTLCKKLDSLLVMECGVPIQKITPETSLGSVLSSRQAPGSENMLFRALEYLLRLRQDFLAAVEQAARDPAAPGALQRIPALLGNGQLAHLVHMPSALAEECRLTVPSFVQRAQAVKQSTGDFDIESLLPTVLRASVVGKSAWALSDIQRDFHLEQGATVAYSPAGTRDGEECPVPWACLPACFSATPVGDARIDIDGCLQSLRQSDLLELLGVLSRASSFMQRWQEAEGSLEFAARLRSAGFELPIHCREALQSQNIHIEHTGFILQELHQRLQTRAFTFAHLPSRLRRPLPATVGARLDRLLESSCEHPTAVDEIIAYFSASEDSFLQQEARPLVAVIGSTAQKAPAHLLEVLPNFPSEVLCRHLFETLLKLLALRLRLAEIFFGGDAVQDVEKWWESAAPQALLEDITSASTPAVIDNGDDDDDDWICLSPEVPDKVLALLRRCLRRHYHRLQHRVRPQAEEMEEGAAPRNVFAMSDDEALGIQRVGKEEWARSVLLRWLKHWLRCHRQAATVDAAAAGDAIDGRRVRLQRMQCPRELLIERAVLPVDENVTQDPSTRGPWHVWVGDQQTTYRMAGTKIFDKVCKLFSLPPSTAVISGAGLCEGLCENDRQAPTHAVIRFVPCEEIVECNALGTLLRVHRSTKLGALAACALQQHLEVDSCFVANSSLELQPSTCCLADTEQPVYVLNAEGCECWHASVSGSVHNLALTATVGALTTLGGDAAHPSQSLRFWSPSLGVLSESDRLQEVVDAQDVQEASLVPAAEIASLKIEVFGVETLLEVHVKATARQVICLLLRSRNPTMTQNVGPTSDQLVLLVEDRVLENEDRVVCRDGEVVQLRLAVVATVAHWGEAARCSSVRLTEGMSAGSLLTRLNYHQPRCCVVDQNWQIIAADTELWKTPHLFCSLSISVPLQISVRAESGETTELQLGCDAGLTNICKAVENAGLLPNGASILWAFGAGKCWPMDPAGCAASLLDLHHELRPSCPEEPRCQRVPTFVVAEAEELAHLRVDVIPQEGIEACSVAVLASRDSLLRDLQVQLATLLHLPPGELALHGGAGEILDEDESLDAVFDFLDPTEGAELKVLILQRLPAASPGPLVLQVRDGQGNVHRIELHENQDAIHLWRLVRWRFSLPPLDFGEDFHFDHKVGVLNFAEDWTMRELQDVFREKHAVAATTTFTDVCGGQHTFVVEWSG